MGTPGKWFQAFIRDPEKRQRAWKCFVHHKNIYAKGQGEFGFLWSALFGLQSLMVGWLFLRDILPWLPKWVFFAAVPLLLIGKIFLFYAIGYFWDREKIFKHEQTWANQRNPIAEQISQKLLNGSGMEVK